MSPSCPAAMAKQARTASAHSHTLIVPVLDYEGSGCARLEVAA
jgi:hypothetical protein